MIKKTVQRSEECYIQFSNEELEQLNIKQGDKFSWEQQDDGIMLKRHVSIDVDISEWSREVLEMLIIESVEKDISVNDVICQILTEQVSVM